MDSSHSVNLDFGLIVPDSPEAVDLGFSSVKFSGDLRLVNGAIYMWRILSKERGKGQLSGLIQRMLDCGYTVKIPTPIGRMAKIVRRKGFIRTVEYDPELEPYEVWVKEPFPVFTIESLAPNVPVRPYEAADIFGNRRPLKAKNDCPIIPHTPTSQNNPGPIENVPQPAISPQSIPARNKALSFTPCT